MISIKKITRTKVPRAPWQILKDRALGKKYELSVVFCTNKLAKKLNESYRGKSSPANILSFPLGKTSGEIFVNVEKAAREAGDYGRTRDEHIVRLFIHGLLHLKGLRHSKKMDMAEERLYAHPVFSFARRKVL